MKNKLPGNKIPGNIIPCEVVRDLFPSYIDGLTSETTTNLVNEHVAECEPCKTVLNAMREPSVQPIKAEDKKEVDFLKKNRVRNRIIALGSVVFAVVAVAVLLFVKAYFIGSTAMDENLAWEIEVNENNIAFKVMAGSQRGISDVNYKEEEGIVKISVNCVQKNPLYNSDSQTEYVAKTDIKQVWLDDRIIWSDGECISYFVSEVYGTKHAYIGDMPDNIDTINMLDLVTNLGDFSNELQTKEEPYGWTLILNDVIPKEEQAEKELLMQYYAYVMLAVIDNLGEVNYQYKVNGALHELNVDTEKASEFAGADIKRCGQEIALLQKLMDKTGLERYANFVFPYTVEVYETIRIKLVNVTDMDIASWALTYYLDGEVYGTQVGINADGSLAKPGDVIDFILTPEDFSDRKWLVEEDFEIEITVTDESGKEYVVGEKRTLEKRFWTSYRYEIHGNTEEGFVIRQ